MQTSNHPAHATARQLPGPVGVVAAALATQRVGAISRMRNLCAFSLLRIISEIECVDGGVDWPTQVILSAQSCMHNAA